MTETLKKNLKHLNEKYEGVSIQFELEGDEIKINDNYAISKNPFLKERLKKELSVTFDWNRKSWYVGKKSIRELSKKIVKVGPVESLSSMKLTLEKYVELIKEDQLRDSIKKLFKNHDFFFKAPSSVYRHHSYEGGLLEHTIQTVRLSLAVTNNAKELIIDKDLLISGSILHDIGKVNCYVFSGGSIEATDINEKQYHIVNGIKIVSQEIESDKLDELIHVIASHHQLKEWGSPVEPMTNEAWIIHLVENLSSRLMG